MRRPPPRPEPWSSRLPLTLPPPFFPRSCRALRSAQARPVEATLPPWSGKGHCPHRPALPPPPFPACRRITKARRRRQKAPLPPSGVTFFSKIRKITSNQITGPALASAPGSAKDDGRSGAAGLPPLRPLRPRLGNVPIQLPKDKTRLQNLAGGGGGAESPAASKRDVAATCLQGWLAPQNRRPAVFSSCVGIERAVQGPAAEGVK